ncbi:conserved hypothetical protein [Candidatus Defluviicoccus seviourii]|uniref:Fido domain-containing protein n=2 Tax=root TaxID=1 RepID=A0A564WEB2_9PROT|nr:conserved hypothetical protein [Candidatus Defluviicoccus seviourii]
MILIDIVKREDNPVYQALQIDNLERQYGFLQSIIKAAISLNLPIFSSEIIKALNAHAIACLHECAGQYRQCQVHVGTGCDRYNPPHHDDVGGMMDDFVEEVEGLWDGTNALLLASFVLWKLNAIHPFVNGNGRTARAICYYVLCVKSNGLLPGAKILPELIRENRDEYVRILKTTDKLNSEKDPKFMRDMCLFISRLVGEQLGPVKNR